MIKTNIAKAKAKLESSLDGPMDVSVNQDFIKNYDNELVLSLILNTNGTHSKNYSMWPILGSNLELAPFCREKISKIIYFDEQKLINF